ncbi:hypothetical protein NGY2020056_01490 [Vibrio cholerae]
MKMNISMVVIFFHRRIIDDEKLIIKYPFYTNDKFIEKLFESKLCVNYSE